MSIESKYWSLQGLSSEARLCIFVLLIINKYLSYGTTNNGRCNGTHHGCR